MCTCKNKVLCNYDFFPFRTIVVHVYLQAGGGNLLDLHKAGRLCGKDTFSDT